MNNLYQQLNQSQTNQSLLQGNSNNIKQLMNQFKNSSNPKQFLLNYIQNNPQTQGVYDMLKNSNKSPKELFYSIAQQRGVDPNSILNMLK